MNEHTRRGQPVLVLDFDGTVCVGDEPVWAYAEAVIAEILDRDEGVDPQLDDTIRARLSAFLDGEPGSAEYADGYAAVASISRNYADSELLEKAYRRSRRALADGSLDIHPPERLAEFLTDLGPHTRRVLVTNAPAQGVPESVDSLGLSGCIDTIYPNAAKPSGWRNLLPHLLEGRSPELLMSVGDIWANDLSAPLAVGCAGALIDRFDHNAGPAHLRGRTFPELYEGITEWVRDPLVFFREHPLPSRTSLRTLHLESQEMETP